MTSRTAGGPVLMVLTRPIPANPTQGREKTLAFIHRALSSRYKIETFLLDDAQDPALARAWRSGTRLLGGLLRREPPPLQVALFHQRRRLADLQRAIARSSPRAVYFDSIRSVDALLDTRRRHPDLRLICDFDDLMSLRFAMLHARRLPISLGYLRDRIPPWLRDFLQTGPVTRAVLAYEARTLRRMERRAVAAADAVTVVSTTDAAQLRQDVGTHLSARTHVVPPGVRFSAEGIRTQACRSFVFVGADGLLQNRMTIEFLLGLWRTVSPSLPLRIVGRMTQRWPETPGVTFTGFVDDIADVYRDDCVALCPSFMEGGVKTKVLEALGHGVVPIGTPQTFEGMGCAPGCLAASESLLRDMVTSPDAHLSSWIEAARELRACIHGRYSFDAVADAWASLM